MAAERAVERHKAVANQPIGQDASTFLKRGCSRIARDTRRQRNRSNAVRRDRAMSQVLYPGASRLAESRQRRRVRAQIENEVEPVATALERRAVMRCAEENNLGEST